MSNIHHDYKFKVLSYRLLYFHFALLLRKMGHFWVHSVGRSGSVKLLKRVAYQRTKITVIILRFLQNIRGPLSL